jgi:hypothetical protein
VLFCKSLYFRGNEFNNFFIFYFIINAKDNKNLSAKLFLEVVKTCFHSLSRRVVPKICFSSHRFNLDTKCLFTNPAEVIDITGMVELGVTFYKFYIGKGLCKIIFNNRFLPDKTIKCPVNSQVVDVVNTVLKSKLIKCFSPFRDYDFLNFYKQSFS